MEKRRREPPSYTARPDRATRNNVAEKQTLDSASTSLSTETNTEASTSTTTDNNTSTDISAPPPPTPFQTQFASLSLHQNDRLRLLDFPDPAIITIKNAIQTSWPHGLQDQRLLPFPTSIPSTITSNGTTNNTASQSQSHSQSQCLELKLKGLPWLGVGSDSMHARRLILTIFSHLFSTGWILSLTTDVSKKTKDKDTLIFRHQSPPPAPRDWLCVAFSKKDRLRLMDAPASLTTALSESLSDQIQEVVSHPLPGVWEAKLRGWPWHSRDAESIMGSRRLLLRLMGVLESQGFTVYASVDQKADLDSEKSETDTWHCCRPRGWEGGMPVYHA